MSTLRVPGRRVGKMQEEEDGGAIIRDWNALWGPERSHRDADSLALEALCGWEETRCGAGVIRCAGGAPIAIVHNVVSTSMLSGDRGSGMPIDLHRLAMYLPCSSYNRRRFAAITIRISNPRCTALLFTSGKLVITGVRSFYECTLASLCVNRVVTAAMVGSRYARPAHIVDW